MAQARSTLGPAHAGLILGALLGTGAGASEPADAAHVAGIRHEAQRDHGAHRRHTAPLTRGGHAAHHANHLSALAGTTAHSGDTASTYGLDYEYRLGNLIGIGAVAEHAVAPIEATTLLAVADVHVWRALAVQTGPGAELLHDPHAVSADAMQVRFVYRVGLLYEFALGRTTISPQLHYDLAPGATADSVVAALAFGMGF